MEVQRTIDARKSVRSYMPRPIPDEVLARVLEAGRLSPSAVNYQPWHFVVVTDPEKKKVLSEGQYGKFVAEAPVVIVGLADKVRSPKWHIVDTTIALQTMVLAATSEGLGTCWVGSFPEGKVRQALGVPDDYVILALIPLGYSRERDDRGKEPPRPKNRKSLKEIVSYESFGQPMP